MFVNQLFQVLKTPFNFNRTQTIQYLTLGYFLTMVIPAYAEAGFPAGTLVHTEKGMLPIEQVTVGAKILAFDEQEGQIDYQIVLAKIEQTTEVQAKIVTHANETIIATIDQLFYLEGSWRNAHDLKAADMFSVADAIGISSIEIQAIPPKKMYSLSITKLDNYFIGELGILVKQVP